jgi:three-Cys-motif partner protein
MASKYRNKFFDIKREWSKYKDSVLDYYLVPYLQIVKDLRRPVCVVDMFAGRGEFKSGEQGSPLIIARRLQDIAQRGYAVKLLCYENYKPFHAHLVNVLKPFPFAQAVQKDCFTDVANIAQLASTHTMLLYIDPCEVVQLSLSKLGLVFDKVRQNSSVEALIVFMARAFMRQASWARSVELRSNETGALDDPLVMQSVDEDDKAMWIDALYGNAKEVLSQQAQAQKAKALLSDIAGGEYWARIVDDEAFPWEERVARLVDDYRRRLRTSSATTPTGATGWFRIVEALSVRPDVSPIPKYWIVFMSRYEPAFDLFNRAACNMARTQDLNIKNTPGTLFAGMATEPEPAAPQVVDRAVKRTAKPLTTCKCNELRWRTCGDRNVGNFTDSEVDQSIKRLLKEGWLTGASGNKIEETSVLSPTDQLKSWIDR